jgi:predicted acyltransferase
VERSDGYRGVQAVAAAAPIATRAAEAATRLVSLDAFRGFTIASMNLVNNAGSEPTYTQLEHAEWNGWTFTDTVFPFFVWISGLAMTLSFAKRVEQGADRMKLFLHTLKRAALIFALGLFLNAFPYFALDHWRIPGVLQRIAICYAIAGAIFLTTKIRGQIAWNIFFLVLYVVLMHGNYDKETNFARYVDGLFLQGHMYSHTKTWDPEGLVSTLPAISTALFGILAGHLVRSKLEPAVKTVWLLAGGNALVCIALILSAWIPINKNLWTTSYSIFMAGLASIAFAIFYWLIDVNGWRKWSRPFVIYGMNAIAIYALASMTARLLGVIKPGGVALETRIYDTLFAPLARQVNASVMYAAAFVLVMYGAAYVMYRKRWFVRL